MKTSFKLRHLSFVFLVILLNSCGPKPPTEIVTLIVDTEGITAVEDEKEVDLSKYCRFDGQKSDQTLENFLTTVKKGQSIEWRGVAQNGEDIVNIDKIKYRRGTNPFPNGRTELDGTGDKGKKVKVKLDKLTGEERCKYAIKFSIEKGETLIDKDKYDIDPEVEVQQ